MDFYEINLLNPFKKYRKAVACENGMYAYVWANRFGMDCHTWHYSDFIYSTCIEATKALRACLKQRKHG